MLLQGIDVRRVLKTLSDLPNWQKNNPNPSVTQYFKRNPDMVAKVPKLSSADIKTLTELLKIIEVPFVNKEQGNEFRTWMNKNHPDWKAQDGDVLDSKGSYNNKWISEAWRQYRNEFIKTDSYVPEIPYTILSSALTCIKTKDKLVKQYGGSISSVTDIKNLNQITDFSKSGTKELTKQEKEAILDYIKTNLQEQISNKDGKKKWKNEVEVLRKTLKTHDSRVKLATQLDPGFKLITKYQQQSNEPGWGEGGLRHYRNIGGSAEDCYALGKWLIEIKFTEEDEYQAMFDELDSDGDGNIKLAPDAGNECMMCHRFIGPNALTPNAQDRLLMNIAFKSMEVMPEKLYKRMAEVKDWFMDDGYHLLIDICSFVTYLLCPVTYGIGCAASIGFDILNAYAYVNWDDEKDYYSAGMQLAFAVVPGGELLKITFKQFKPFLSNMFKRIFKDTITKKWIITSIASMTPATKKVFRELLRPYAHVFPTAGAVKAMEVQLNGWLRAIKPYMSSSLFSTAKQVKDWALRNFRWWIVFVEQMAYDPAQSIFTLLGDLSDKYVPQLGLKSYTDMMKDWDKYGLNFYNFILDRYDLGGMEAIVQTSVDSCTNKVYATRYSQSYEWETVKKAWITSETSSADPYLPERGYWEDHPKGQAYIDKAKREQKSGFKTIEDKNLREYKSRAIPMVKHVYTPINGEWHIRLKDTEDEWVNMVPKGDLWDEDKFRDDWFKNGWRPDSESNPEKAKDESGQMSLEEMMEFNALTQATRVYNKFKTCQAMLDVSEFKKYLDDCKLFISIWMNNQEQDSEENKIRTAMDLVYTQNCR